MQMLNNKRKYTFPEYLSTIDSDDHQVDQVLTEYWIKELPNMLNKYSIESHRELTKHGHCTCTLCALEKLLEEYREYYFEENK